MNISAILVVVAREDVQPMSERISELPGLEVHHQDELTGRLIVTQEAPTIDDEVDGLRRLQQLPGVQLAEMVEHHFDSEGNLPAETTDAIPALLSN